MIDRNGYKKYFIDRNVPTHRKLDHICENLLNHLSIFTICYMLGIIQNVLPS